jgi:hypothetical protein
MPLTNLWREGERFPKNLMQTGIKLSEATGRADGVSIVVSCRHHSRE